MTVTQLVTRRVEKIWGRRDLPPVFGTVSGSQAPIGEIWFEDPSGRRLELLVKFLFTSQNLSIQVHPNEEQAKARGGWSGKDEAWLLLAAEPDARIGLGLKAELDAEALRSAALAGDVDTLLDWRPVRAGDFYYSPAGTIHSIGAGLTLVEVQQNVDLTYRLFDYGRQRGLHIDDAVSVANLGPHVPMIEPYEMSEGRQILAHGSAFVLERWCGVSSGALEAEHARPVWLVSLEGGGTIDGASIEPGTVWVVDDEVALTMRDDSVTLVAYPGAKAHVGLLR